MADKENGVCCKKCGRQTIDASEDSERSSSQATTNSWSSVEKCQSWLEKCTFSDSVSEVSCESGGSGVMDTASTCESDGSSALAIFRRPYKSDDKPERLDGSIVEHDGINIDRMNMQQCKNVHVGNVTYITGPVHITQNTSTLQQQNVINKYFLEDAVGARLPRTSVGVLTMRVSVAVTRKSSSLNIIDRRLWLAQPALHVTPLQAVPTYVVISHTATEAGITQADNTLMVRLVQTFHIESKRWDDIGYNFLIGSDGNVYEGRGWRNQGAHTHGYNYKAIGISFIGTFIAHLPPECALVACQKLIEQGVRLGHLSADYTLVGHCQCVATESPGKCLYEHIKTWPRWRELTPADVQD